VSLRVVSLGAYQLTVDRERVAFCVRAHTASASPFARKIIFLYNVINMEDTKAVVNLDIDKQFFEITEGLVNFEVDFEVQTENDAPFEIAVVDQQTLDSDQFPYRRVDDGHVKGKVTNDNNRRVPFFMVLRADAPTRASVSLDKLSLPLTAPASTTTTTTTPSKTPVQQQSEQQQRRPKRQKAGLETFMTFAKNRNLLIFVLVAVLAALWWFRRRRSNAPTLTPTPPQLATQSVASSPLSLIASPSNTNFGF
jgi:hypothetical protein